MGSPVNRDSILFQTEEKSHIHSSFLPHRQELGCIIVDCLEVDNLGDVNVSRAGPIPVPLMLHAVLLPSHAI
jgi:hypothetical protein